MSLQNQDTSIKMQKVKVVSLEIEYADEKIHSISVFLEPEDSHLINLIYSNGKFIIKSIEDVDLEILREVIAVADNFYNFFKEYTINKFFEEVSK